jgi:chorismate mutase
MERDRTACRGVRGAIGVDGDVGAATRQLLDALVEANALRVEDVAAAIFTLTDDLAGANPAAAAREHGWSTVPLLVVKESGDAGLERCLRVLVLWNTSVPQDRVRHVYLGRASSLRPDLVEG